MTTTTKKKPKTSANEAVKKRPLDALGFRAIFIVPIAVFVIARTLAGFAALIQDSYLRIHYDVRFELGMVVGQVLFQWLLMTVIWPHKWRAKLDYGLILIAVSLLGAALLWPLLLMAYYAATTMITPLVATAYFFVVVAIIFGAHYALVKKADLPKGLCVTWVIYRLLILAFVVKW